MSVVGGCVLRQCANVGYGKHRGAVRKCIKIISEFFYMFLSAQTVLGLNYGARRYYVILQSDQFTIAITVHYSIEIKQE